jgi:hypothetical protein
MWPDLADAAGPHAGGLLAREHLSRPELGMFRAFLITYTAYLGQARFLVALL